MHKLIGKGPENSSIKLNDFIYVAGSNYQCLTWVLKENLHLIAYNFFTLMLFKEQFFSIANLQKYLVDIKEKYAIKINIDLHELSFFNAFEIFILEHSTQYYTPRC